MDDYKDMDEQQLRKAARKIRRVISILPPRYSEASQLLKAALKDMGMVADISKKPKKEITVKGKIVSQDELASKATSFFRRRGKK